VNPFLFFLLKTCIDPAHFLPSQNPQEAPYHRIMRAAHVIKGAAANLMCHQLRAASYALEQAAKAAHEAGANITPQHQAAVQQNVAGLQQAAANLVQFLKSIGV
jgi:HPt (histidine-containing phosphotransfer) domain-containing protein